MDEQILMPHDKTETEELVDSASFLFDLLHADIASRPLGTFKPLLMIGREYLTRVSLEQSDLWLYSVIVTFKVHPFQQLEKEGRPITKCIRIVYPGL